MHKVSALLAFAAALLSGCDRAAPNGGIGGDADNPLEAAARERGVVRSEAATPVGVFERTHDLGRDAMCVVPDGAGRWRFAVTAAFVASLSCTATGTMTRDDNGGCGVRCAGADGGEAIWREEDDELRLPGRLPPQCERLCPNRASLSGLRLPRASWSARDAGDLRMADRQGNMLRPCDG